jgi:DNA-binding response OmpR family regulator
VGAHKVDEMARSTKTQSASLNSTARRPVRNAGTDVIEASHPAPTMRVLLVEDDETIAAGLSFFLEEAGYLVDWSQVGAGITTKVIDEPPDLLILDVQLGDADGREIYRALRNAGVLVPVVLVSGSDIVTASELDDVAAFLQKPFAIENLLRTASALLTDR